MLSHITRIAEVISADAAADEQLAGQMLQLGGGAPADLGGAGLGSGAPVLPADLFSASEGHQQRQTLWRQKDNKPHLEM